MRGTAVVTLCLLCSIVCSGEEPPLDPKRAWEELDAQLREARTRGDMARYREIRTDLTAAFLERWERAGAAAAGEESLYLGLLLATAMRQEPALEAFLVAAADDSAPDGVRSRARSEYATLVTRMRERGGEKLDAAIRRLESFAGAEPRPEARGSLLHALGSLLEQRGDTDDAVERWMAGARLDPARAYAAGSRISRALLPHVVEKEQLESLRARALGLVDELYAIEKADNEKVYGDLEAHPTGRPEKRLERIAGLKQPWLLLGAPAPDWTLEHAYGKTRSLADARGKVVVLDFWATWCPWCIRSFPALRDLVRDYGGREFLLVGVTASAGRVWAQRYDLDADLAGKAEGRSPPALELRRDASPEEQAEHRRKEKEVVARFVENHELAWDIVMIDGAEPAAKYALRGWPHAVVIDKQGRIRFLKPGALLRDRPEEVAKFREVLDALLLEE